MECRKCGAQIPDDSIRCSNCGIKVNIHCPNCKTLNAFGSKVCSSCGFELIKICPSCGASNIYVSKECRKCHHSFVKETVENDIPQVIEEKQKEVEIVEETPVKEEKKVQPKKTLSSQEVVRAFSSTQSVYSKDVKKVVSKEKVEHKYFLLDEDVKTTPEEEEKELVFEVDKQVSNDEDMSIDGNLEVEPLIEYVDDNVQQSLNEEVNVEPETPIEEDELLKLNVQPDIAKKVINTIQSSIIKQVVAIQGPEGCGKTAVLKQVSNYLSAKGYVFLYGSCTPLVQITSFGFFQDAFLRIMGFPPYTKSIEAFVKNFKKSSYYNLFSFLEPNELNLFLNIFYPSQNDVFDSILENKQKMFEILEKVIKSFSLNNNLVITIDNFELLDGASYDFIVYMMEKGYFNNRLKLLVAYQEDKAIQSYFDVSKLDDKFFQMVKMEKLSKEEMLKTVSTSLTFDISEIMDSYYLDELIQKSEGNALRIEQEIALLFNTKYISLKGHSIVINEDNKPEIDPVSFEELIKLRLNSLSPVVKNVLFMAAIMGFRFSTNILCLSVSMPVQKAEQLINYLVQEQFIQSVDNYTCEFKSLTIWKLIYQEAKADLLYKENSEKLYWTLKPLILSSNLQKLISCTEALSKNEAFLIWENTAGLSAKMGDTNLYVISQKQCLKILEEQPMLNSDVLKSEIYEQIGKLLCEKSPKEAITYLSNVLDLEIKEGNINKIIDISGYFVKSCYIAGNYFGASEAVDTIISNIEKSNLKVSDCEIALIKTRKLKALFSIGNCEQIINLVNEDIIRDLEISLVSKNISVQLKSLIVDAWLTSKTILAKAYAMQGNNKVFSVVKDLKNFLEKYNYNSEYYMIQIGLIEAFAYTIIGEINKSNESLHNLSVLSKQRTIEPELLAEWNLINIINRVFLNENKDLKVDLFEMAAFTNNINEHFTKNIIKLILGSVLKDEGNTQKALEIYNEQITYFAKEKVAIGALLSWLLIVQSTLEMGDIDKALNTANKSLEIAQSPKINNYFFIIYFQKIIAEIYVLKGDFTAAKMYLEKAIMLAKQQELKYQIIELYVAYGNYMEEFMRITNNYSSNNVNITNDLYAKALNLAKELRLNNMIELVNKEKSEFKTFCHLNSIS
ncbi:MAG: hypothetical protein E7Z90_01750 [Cyanobacteria bacterium SIG29]|nr:hypothetical protein [Cyanobacteria bacterium SIG29]